MKKSAVLLIPILLVVQTGFAQSSSFIELYDSTGNQKTGRLGWKGNAADGHFFIEGQNKEVTVKNGTVNADKFVGDGSALTNLPAQITTVSVSDVRGLPDSLRQKAPLAHTHSASQITDTIPASKIQYGQFMINSAGEDGQVWKSDGDGRGYWGTDNTSSGTGTGGPVSWTDVTNKPSTFNPAPHTHTKAEISDMPIRSADLGDTSVSTAKIKDAAVTTAKIADGAVSGAKIGSSAVTTTHFNTNIYGGTGSAATVARSDHNHSGLYQSANTHLDDLADGLLSGSKVGSGINAENITAGLIGIDRFPTIPGSKVNPVFGVNERILLQDYFDNASNFFMRGRIGNGTYQAITSSDSMFLFRMASQPINLQSTSWQNDNAGGVLIHFGQPNVLAVNGGIYTNSNITADNNIYCKTLHQSSDERLKKNIEPLNGALEKLGLLQGVTFKWKDSGPANRNPAVNIGLIAQDVEKVLPEVVTENSDGYKSVAYQNIIPVLIEAIKELEEKYERLQTEFVELRSECEAK